MFKKLGSICAEHRMFCFISGAILIILLVLPLSWRWSSIDPYFGMLDNKEKEVALSGFSLQGQADSKRETIRIGGSASVYPFFRILVQEFERQNPDFKVAFMPKSHTKGGIMGVVSREYDLGFMSREPTPEENDLDFIQIPFALDGLAFVLHTSSEINNLSTRQILDIYSGKITNWKEVGGNDAPIVVLDRPEHTSAKLILKDKFFPADFKITPQAIVLEKPAQMNESLKFMDNSIGYTSVGDLARESSSLTIISVDNVSPAPSNVQKRIYPYYRTFSLAVNPKPEKKVMRLFSFLVGKEGGEVIEKAGYSPVTLKLVFATIPEQNILKQEKRYRSLVNYLKKKLDSRINIQLKHLSSYEDVITEFMSGNVNAAFFGSLTYAIVQAKLGGVAVARPEKDGVSQYRGLILARRDSNIKSWQDLKGKSFSMIKATTAADLFPRLYLKRQGILTPETFFGKIHYTGSHDASVGLIYKKVVDAGAVKDLIFEKLARENPRIKEELVVIARSLPVPENTLVIRRDLNIVCYSCHFNLLDREASPTQQGTGLCDYLKRELQNALVALEETPEGQKVLKNLGADRFLPTSDKDYYNLYEMTSELGIDLAQYPL